MYAVVATGGKQYPVEPDQVLRVEKLAGNKGDSVSFDQVLLYHDGDQLRIGQPTLSDIRVNGRILEQGKYRKIIVFRSKRRKGYHKKNGHRQQFTAVKIDGIAAA